jgi:hypothetical protein
MYRIRSVNPDTGNSHVVSGGPWTAGDAGQEVQRLRMEETTGSSKRLTPVLHFVVEPIEETP